MIIDGWSGLRDADSAVEVILDEVLARGPGLGVHTVLTISAIGQLRTRLAAGFGGRIELRLGDSFESTIDRRLAKALPGDRPGRALVIGSHYAQIALPLSNGSQKRLVDEIRRRWPGPAVARINTLPAVIPLADVRNRLPTWPDGGRRSPSARRLVLGLAENDPAPVQHSLAGPNPHLLIYGDTGSGKTALLRSILSQLISPRRDDRGADLRLNRDSHAGSTAGDGFVDAERPASTSGSADASGSPHADSVVLTSGSADASGSAHADSLAVTSGSAGAGGSDLEANDPISPTDEVLAIDFRCGLPNGVGRYRRLTRTSEAVALCAALISVLSARLSELPARPDGNAEIYLLVDDYELIGSPAGNPLNALLPFLAHARDIGFHLILARSSGGAARAQYEPLLQALGDLGTPVLLLSGAPTEGRLGHGLVPQPFPPGRAQFAMRGSARRIIQLGWTEPYLQ